MSSLLNKKKVKEASLEICQKTGRPFTRVGASWVSHIEVKTLEAIKSAIHSHPSIGKTLLGP